MSRKIVPALIALLIGATIGLFFRPKGSGEKPRPPHAIAAPAASPDLRSESPPSPAPASTAAPVSAAPEAALLSGEAALEAITDLSATYDAASVPALARYLKHRDPETRAAARDGLINLGERAAIPFLEEAAKTASAEEAAALREAAEFLALPTWTEQREAEKKARAAQTGAQ